MAPATREAWTEFLALGLGPALTDKIKMSVSSTVASSEAILGLLNVIGEILVELEFCFLLFGLLFPFA